MLHNMCERAGGMANHMAKDMAVKGAGRELCKNMNDENLNGTQPHTKIKTINH